MRLPALYQWHLGGASRKASNDAGFSGSDAFLAIAANQCLTPACSTRSPLPLTGTAPSPEGREGVTGRSSATSRTSSIHLAGTIFNPWVTPFGRSTRYFPFSSGVMTRTEEHTSELQ